MPRRDRRLPRRPCGLGDPLRGDRALVRRLGGGARGEIADAPCRDRRASWSSPAPAGPFTLRGRADRIDAPPDGRLDILDFKTGTPPSARQVLRRPRAAAGAGGGDGAARRASPSIRRPARRRATSSGSRSARSAAASPYAPPSSDGETADGLADDALARLDGARSPPSTRADRAYLSRARPMFETPLRERLRPSRARPRMGAGRERGGRAVSRPPRSSIDAATRQAQADASNPRASAWVSANAGSGKTYRAGAPRHPPAARRRRSRRASSASPSPRRPRPRWRSRVFDILAELDDARRRGARRSDSQEIEGRRPTQATLAEARRLFARALETPGGLKIQTIHAFCERLLHQFPFEANVAGHFEVLDERDADGADRRGAPQPCSARAAARSRRPARPGARTPCWRSASDIGARGADRRVRRRARPARRLDHRRTARSTTRSPTCGGALGLDARRDGGAPARRDHRRVRRSTQPTSVRLDRRCCEGGKHERPGGRGAAGALSSTPSDDDARPTPISISAPRPTANCASRRASSPSAVKNDWPGLAEMLDGRARAPRARCSTGSRAAECSTRPPPCCASPTRRSPTTSG